MGKLISINHHITPSKWLFKSKPSLFPIVPPCPYPLIIFERSPITQAALNSLHNQGQPQTSDPPALLPKGLKYLEILVFFHSGSLAFSVHVCMYMCVFMCVRYTYRYLYVCIWSPEDNFEVHLQEQHPSPLRWGVSLTLAWSSPIRVNCLVGESKESCLHLPDFGIMT